MSQVINAANATTMINMAATPPTFQDSATRIAAKNLCAKLPKLCGYLTTE
jgi:hypothetical protein